MKVGLIDVDGHNFPSLPLMKISAWHKEKGDEVQWYSPMFSGHLDRVYMSKVFTNTPDYEYCISADEITKGGTWYHAVRWKAGFDRENYRAGLDSEIEFIYPDYSLYPELTKNTAFGFLTRGCPRDCGFCVVTQKEGNCSVKVADLNQFFRGQKNIELLDPNITACKDWEDLFGQLIESKAWVNFNQGLDIRFITPEKTAMLRKMKVKHIHFAWDRYEDKNLVVPMLEQFAKDTRWKRDKVSVYVLVNYKSTFEQDLERVYTIRDIGFSPYIMRYDKESIPEKHGLHRLARYVNNRYIFNSCKTFEEYMFVNHPSEKYPRY